MDDKIALQNIKNITVTITDKNGNVASLVSTGDELIERIKSMMYQSLAYSLNAGVSEVIAVMSLATIKDHAAVKHIMSQKYRQDVSYSSREGWKKDWYFEINKERFEFTNQVEANYILEHIQHINNRLPLKK